MLLFRPFSIISHAGESLSRRPPPSASLYQPLHGGLLSEPNEFLHWQVPAAVAARWPGLDNERARGVNFKFLRSPSDITSHTHPSDGCIRVACLYYCISPPAPFSFSRLFCRQRSYSSHAVPGHYQSGANYEITLLRSRLYSSMLHWVRLHL
jgi:hypothetical protein